jgi:hypothetical protein
VNFGKAAEQILIFNKYFKQLHFDITVVWHVTPRIVRELRNLLPPPPGLPYVFIQRGALAQELMLLALQITVVYYCAVAAFWYEDYVRIYVLLVTFIRLLHITRP